MKFMSRLAIASAMAITLVASVMATPARADNADKISGVGQIAYVSGGVGVESRKHLNALSGFNLRLGFVLRSGEFLSDVKVAIFDKAGTLLLETVSDGPVFLARLPPNRYRVAATFADKTFTRKVSTRSRGTKAWQVIWPTEPASAAAPAESPAIAALRKQHAAEAEAAAPSPAPAAPAAPATPDAPATPVTPAERAAAATPAEPAPAPAEQPAPEEEPVSYVEPGQLFW